MRTLKKTLALVLVLTMMVGLCAVGAFAITVDEYKDKDQIPNMEAFATLTAIGVFQGDDKGNVNPTASLTRAEGATLGAKMHGTSGAGTSSFTDMAGYDWAQPAVAYCEANGIIAGYGDGSFGPKDTLSTVAFAKIMLTSLGYDAVREGLVGSQWEINTIKLVNALNLADGIGNPDWNGPCQRWVAGQFCYNTLKATMVDYNSGLNMSVTTPDGTKVEVGTGAGAVINNSYDYRNILHDNANDTMQFCEMYFPTLKQKTNVADNAFGFTNNVWYQGDTRVDNVLTKAKQIVKEQASTNMAIYDTGIAGVSAKTLYTDGSAIKNKGFTTVKVNGYDVTADVAATITMDRLGALPVLGAYKGSTAYLVDTSSEDSTDYGIADTLIIKQPLLAQVTKVTEATATADRTLTLTIYNKEKGTPGLKWATTQYAKGDWILVYPAYTSAAGDFNTTTLTILESALADSTNGTLSKLANDAFKVEKYSALTIGGVSYSVGSKAYAGPYNTSVGNADYTLGTGMTAYLSNGFVLGIVSDAVAYGDYVFVLGADHKTNTLNTTTYLAGSVDQTAATSEDTATKDAAGLIGKWASKIESTGGKFAFAEAVGKDGTTPLTVPFTTTKLSSDTAVLDTTHNVIADANTVFVVATENATTHVVTYKSYTGLANVPNYPAKGETATLQCAALVPDYPGAHAAAVYVNAGTAKQANTTSTVIYFLGGPSSSEKSGAYTIYNYSAIVDGAVTTLQSTSSTDFAGKSGLYTPAYSGSYLAGLEDPTGTIGKITVAKSEIYTISVDANVITLPNGLGTYVLDPDAVAYHYVNAYAPLETGAPVDVLNGLAGGEISFVKVTGKDSIKAIYFVDIA